MSFQDYEHAIEIMRAHPNLMHFAGKRSEELIKLAETALSVQFPPTYRKFLLDFGAGGFGGEEIYGVIGPNFSSACSPDAIGLTLERRSKYLYPVHLIFIAGDGMGYDYALDLSQENKGENSVVVGLGDPKAFHVHEIVATDFGAFLLDIVSSQIKTDTI